jgi:hypothetical protein
MAKKKEDKNKKKKAGQRKGAQAKAAPKVRIKPSASRVKDTRATRSAPPRKRAGLTRSRPGGRSSPNP